MGRKFTTIHEKERWSIQSKTYYGGNKQIKILYVITTYNPHDNSPNYLCDTGFVFDNLKTLHNLKYYATSNVIDIVIADFKSGDKTREWLVDLRSKMNWDYRVVCGDDQSAAIGLNSTVKLLNHDYRYDYVMYSTSDSILTTPDTFDKGLELITNDTNCGWFHPYVTPGINMPKSRVLHDWYEKMPLYGCVHCHVIGVKKAFLQHFENRILPDILTGTFEGIIGYLLASCGMYRKVVAEMTYVHHKKMTPDRKYGFPDVRGKMRGSGNMSMSPYAKRDMPLSELLSSPDATSCGIFHIQDKNLYANFVDCVLDVAAFREITTEKRELLNVFVKEHFFLKPCEFDYNMGLKII